MRLAATAMDKACSAMGVMLSWGTHLTAQIKSWPTVLINNVLTCEDDSCFIPLLPFVCKGDFHAAQPISAGPAIYMHVFSPSFPYFPFPSATVWPQPRLCLAPASPSDIDSVQGQPEAQVLPSADAVVAVRASCSVCVGLVPAGCAWMKLSEKSFGTQSNGSLVRERHGGVVRAHGYYTDVLQS